MSLRSGGPIMDLRTTIVTNHKIMALIESKYQEVFPGSSQTPEARYYKKLECDTKTAQDALKHGGIRELPEE